MDFSVATILLVAMAAFFLNDGGLYCVVVFILFYFFKRRDFKALLISSIDYDEAPNDVYVSCRAALVNSWPTKTCNCARRFELCCSLETRKLSDLHCIQFSQCTAFHSLH